METSRLVINGRVTLLLARIMRVDLIGYPGSADARELRHVCGARES